MGEVGLDCQPLCRLCRRYERNLGANRQLNATLENLKGKVYAFKKDFKKAREHLEASVEMDPNILSSHMALTKLYLLNKEVHQVISHFENVLGDNPEYLPGYMILGIIYDLQGDSEKAESYYRKALEIKHDYAL